MKVIIIGAGIGGISCAISCRKEGLDVTILERAEKLLPIGAGIQIPPNASAIAKHLGLLDQLAQRGTVLEALSFRRYADGRELLRKGKAGNGGSKDPWIVIHRADYLDVLESAAVSVGVEFRFGAEVERVDFESTSVQLVGGAVVQGDVVVAADGLWSATRSHILGEPWEPKETGDLAYRGTFTRAQLDALNDPRINQLCELKESAVYLGPSRHAVFYSLREGQLYNLVLIRPDDLAEGVRKVPGDINEMRMCFEGWDEILTKIISCIPAVLKWKLCGFPELPTWSKNNITLLGDACHPTLPYQAQGAAMALEDGSVLGRLLGLANRHHQPIPQTLHLFEKLRKARTSTIVRGSNDNQIWYHMPDGPEQVARDEAMARWPQGESWPKWAMTDRSYDRLIMGFDVMGECDVAFDEEMLGKGRAEREQARM